MDVHDDVKRIAAEFNYIQAATGAPDDIVIGMLYHLEEARKIAKQGNMLSWLQLGESKN